MNIIGLTQGANISIFLELIEECDSENFRFDKIGAVVSFYRYFKDERIERKNADISYIKEWEIVEQAIKVQPDLQWLSEREKSLDADSIWNSIVGDRRLIYGKYSKFTQDYKCRFTDKELWSIAEKFIRKFDQLIINVKPDVIIGFTPVTFGELLALTIAKEKNIPFLQLHSSRISNYFAFNDVLVGTSRHFIDYFNNSIFSPHSLEMAKNIINESKVKGILYEGVNLKIKQGNKFNLKKAPSSFLGAIYRESLRQLNRQSRNDHHDSGYLVPWFYLNVYQPFRYTLVNVYLGGHKRYILENELDSLGEFAFYPLHSEPEVALQVSGRPYHKNQIELIRNLAASLPVGMKLLVKEHPRSMGLRPVSFYSNLLNEIPNLYFIDFKVGSINIVKRSKFVIVISGTIGLEAAIIGIPLLILGFPKYHALPEPMTKKCYDLYKLPRAIKSLLEEYQYDEIKIQKFIAALIEGSINIDFYSVLLNKSDRYSGERENMSLEEKKQEDINKLAGYCKNRINQVITI